MFRQSLNGGWMVRAVTNSTDAPASVRDATIPARVPGCVHTDLLRAGLIDDPYVGQNEPKLLWIGLTDWHYTTSFDADPKLFDHERIDLVCDGLDTVATIALNGSEVARTCNMHRGYRFDVRPFLRKGRNELTIRFDSPVRYAEQMHNQLGHLPAIAFGGRWFNFIRKMACNFGWDWGPVVPTCGIWRDIRLEGWSNSRIECVRALVSFPTSGRAELALVTRIEGSNARALTDLVASTDVYGPDERSFQGEVIRFNGTDHGVSKLAIAPPLRWWPVGHGPQPRYDVRVTLNHAGDLHFEHPYDQRNFGIGLRTVELDSSPDDIGRKFVIKVNGKPIFCKGFNWIPDDCFLDRACEPTRVRKRVQQALDANANMLRVWGGGIYETDDFYDICDEMGMLVWQDFLFACAAYPEDEPIKSEVEAEAKYNVARLSHHPSLVLWNGCNENLWGYHGWWSDDGTGTPQPWKDQVAGKKWGLGYYLEMLPRIVKELSPGTPYWAASPWSGDPDVENGLHPNLATHGNKHIWEVWHGKDGDYTKYRQFSPRFCSEFGYQGPPTYATLIRAIAGDSPSSAGSPFSGPARGASQSALDSRPHVAAPIDALCRAPQARPLDEETAIALKRGSEFLKLHQKCTGGNEKNDALLKKDFDIPENFDDWHYLLQLNQARALQTGVEWFRSRQPVCMGTLYWQLNDCGYAVTSWSAIDGDGRLKPLWCATRRFYAPRLLTIQPEFDSLLLYANNDSDERWRGEVVVRRMEFVGNELARIVVRIDIAPRSNVRGAVLPPQIAQAQDKSQEFIVAHLGDARAMWFFASDRELDYPSPSPRATIRRDGDLHRLALSTDVLLRDVLINIDRLDPDASIDDNLVTLLPGESITFAIRSAKDLTVEQLMSPPVFQCANRFGRPFPLSPAGRGQG